MAKAFDSPRWAKSNLFDDAPKVQVPGRRAQTRTYASARQTRLTTGWITPNNSADSELVSSLTQLRARSRALCRDASYAKRAKVIVSNNVVGSGITMEPKVVKARGALMENVNDDIEEAWCEWSRPENCHTGGKLHFADLERQAMEQIFEAGEVLIRKHYAPFGSQGLPFALELIEAERLADEFTKPAVQGDVGLYRMGIEHDQFGRALGFWLRRYHPGEIWFPQGVEPNIYFRVPANEMFHLYACNRWPQSRGEPWLHSAARRLNDMDGYSEAEITAARGAASYMATIESPEDALGETEEQDVFELEPGAVEKLSPGQKLNFVAPNRPNPNMDPFMRMMLREVAAGVGVSYESISRDYSQSNYSSSRLALLDDRDLWKVLQQWFIRSFREPLHREWVQQAVMAGKVPSVSATDYMLNPVKFQAAAFRPRGWSWIDPAKEVQAYKDARRAGFMSTSQIIALTGGGVDLEDVASEIQTENAMFEQMGIVITTDPAKILEGRETDATAAAADPSSDPAESMDTAPENNRVIPMKPAKAG